MYNSAQNLFLQDRFGKPYGRSTLPPFSLFPAVKPSGDHTPSNTVEQSRTPYPDNSTIHLSVASTIGGTLCRDPAQSHPIRPPILHLFFRARWLLADGTWSHFPAPVTTAHFMRPLAPEIRPHPTSKF